MKHFTSFIAVFSFFTAAFGQSNYSIRIEEDYTAPDSRLYLKGDEYHKRSIEKGLYICKPAKLPASLDFGFRFDPYNNPQEKNNALYASDLEFTIIKMKGKKESFISVGFNYLYLKFSYNALGQWKWTNYNDDKIYLQGTAAVNKDTNIVSVSYRIGGIRCYINGTEVMQYTFEKDQSTQYLRWENAQVFTKDKKMILALDKVILTGYPASTKFPDEIAKDQALEKARKEEEEKKILSENFVLYRYADWKINKFGFADADKKIIIPTIYDEIKHGNNIDCFQEGFEAVKLNGKWGYINKIGKAITEFKYDYAHDFENGFAVVSIGNHPNTRYGLIDKTGKEILPLTGKYFVSEETISEGLMAVANSEGLFGFYDTNGIEIIAPKYEDAKKFKEGLAAIKINGKWGFIDKTGKEIVPAKFDYVDNFNEGYCVVNIGGIDQGTYAEGGKYGFIDKNGKQIAAFKYFWADPFSDGFALVLQKENGTREFIDTTGKIVLSLKTYDNVRPFAEGLAAVFKDIEVPGEEFPVTKSGCVDKTGKEVIPMTTEFYIWGDKFSEGLISVQQYPKIGYMDKQGKLVIACQYDMAEPFKNGRAKVKLDNKIFYIDKAGQILK